jgi:hypothetical protein
MCLTEVTSCYSRYGNLAERARVKTAINVVLFRLDPRLTDNYALRAATTSGARVVAVYIWSLTEEGSWGPGSASPGAKAGAVIEP